MGEDRETYFAPAARASDDQVERDVRTASASPIMDGLLRAAGGLLAVLNEDRQVLLANHALLEMLGIENPGDLVGLRPGEVIGCDHANDAPAGCGTTRYCSTCGAAVSIVGALAESLPFERKCVLTVPRNGLTTDLCLRARATVVPIGDRRFVLLFLQDVTTLERLSEVQRTFFHDLRNMLCGLQGTAELMTGCSDQERVELADSLTNIVDQLAREARLQQALTGDGQCSNFGSHRPVCAADALADLKRLMRNHPAATTKHLDVESPAAPLVVVSDPTLINRVLVNMVVNALEATARGGTVRVWAERREQTSGAAVAFLVWNAGVIPKDTALRVFQRHFSTKAETARGIGTWSMKLIGEQFLQGTVDFTTGYPEGTTFCFTLPEGASAEGGANLSGRGSGRPSTGPTPIARG